MRVNWKLIVVVILAVIALMITAIGLRQYHRTERKQVGLTRGLEAFEAQEWGQAVRYLGQYLSINPQNTEILIKYAQSQMRIKPFKESNLAQAVNAYRTVLRNENNTQAADELIRVYLDFGMSAEAERIARDFVDKDEDGQFRQMLAQALIRQRQFEEAVEILTELIQQQPDQIAAYQLLGQIIERRPDVNEMSVQDVFEKAVAKNPSSSQAYIMRSTYYAKKGNISKALEDLQQAEQCDTSSTGVRLSLAAAWFNLGKDDNAIAHLRAVRQTSSDNLNLWRIWAGYALKTENAEIMLQVAEDGITSLKNDVESFLPIAIELFVQSGHLDRARECITTLKDAEVNRGVILYLEGFISYAELDWADTIQKWRQAMNLGYTTEQIYLRLANVYVQVQNESLAIQTLRRYIDNHEDAVQARLQLSKLYANDGRWNEVMDQVLAVLRSNPADSKVRLWYLRCRIEMLQPGQKTDTKILKEEIQKQLAENATLDAEMLLYRVAMKMKDYDAAAVLLDNIEKKYGSSQTIAVEYASLYSAQGNDEQATTCLEDAAQEYPDSQEIRKLLVERYIRSEQFQKCRRLIEIADRKDAPPAEHRMYQLWLAELSVLQGDPDQAVSILTTLADNNEGDIFARRQLLSLQAKKAPVQQLQQWVDQIKDAEGENGWQWKYEQARLWYNRDDFKSKYAQIIGFLNSNLVFNPDDYNSRILLASSHERAGNIHLAMSTYQDILIGDAGSIDLVVAAVGTLYRAGEYARAQEVLNELEKRGIQDVRLSQYELQSNLRLGREENVMTALEKMAVSDPDDEDAGISLALLYIRKGDFEKALRQIDMLSSKHPESVAIVAAKADLFFSMKQPGKALQACQTYLSEYDTLQSHVMLAQVLLMMDDTEALLRELETLESRFSDNGRAMVLTAKLYQKIGRTDKALKIVERLLSTDLKDDFVVQKEVALLLLGQTSPDRYRTGREYLELALQQNPRDLELRFKKAEMLMKERTAVSLEQAKTLLKSITHEYPSLESAWVALAQVCMLEDNVGVSIDCLMQGLSYVPSSKRLLMMKARIESARSPMLAINTLQMLHSRYPDDIDITLMLSGNYRKTKQFPKALTLLENVSTDSSADQALQIKQEQMRLFWEMGNSEQAQEVYDNLVTQTDSPTVLLDRLTLEQESMSPANMAEIYTDFTVKHPDTSLNALGPVLNIITECKHPDAFKVARQVVDAALKNHAENPLVCYEKAMVLHKAGDWSGAILWYEKTLELKPDQPTAINNLAWLLCTQKQEYEKAVKLADRGLDIAPNYVDLIDTRATIRMEMGRYEQAIEDFRRCSEMYFQSSPKRTASMFLLGKCLFKLDQKDQALIELMKARQQNSLYGGLSQLQSQEMGDMLNTL